MRKDQPTSFWTSSGLVVFAVCLLLPFLMGVCPEFRNQSVTAIETATRGVANAAFDLFFDQFRTDDVN